MSRAFINLKKKGEQNTRGQIETRLTKLDKRWEAMKELHEKITALKTTANASVNYFKENFIADAEETYLDERAKFVDALLALEAASRNTAGSGNQTNANGSGTQPNAIEPHPTSRRKMPQINMPNFSGNYSEWTSFKDYFTTLVIQNMDISNVERLHYLKASLSGDAAQTIKNISITDANYTRAWTKLTSHYDNKRSLIYSCLDALFKLEKMSTESPSALRLLRGGTVEAIETLEVLGRPTDQLDDILVHLTVQRLDPRTHRDWELSLGRSTNPPTLTTSFSHAFRHWNELTLMKSAHQLVRISRMENLKSLHGNPRLLRLSFRHIQRPKPHLRARFVKENITLLLAINFVLSLDNRNQFVSENRLCYNCLGTHSVRNCRSNKTCLTCHGRHHSTLHRIQGQSRGADSNSPAHQSSQSVTTHTCNAVRSQPAPMLLATAKLSISSEEQREATVRALIDPCSEASFITESIAQQLRLPRQSAFVPVSGVGAAPCSTARTQADIFIGSCIDKGKYWRLKALILPNLTEYLSSPQLIQSDFSFVAGLSLADPQLNSSEPIQAILGADLYPRILEQGLRKDTNGTTVAQATGLGWILTGSQTATANVTTPRQLAPSITSLQCIIDKTLSSQLEQFWLQEELVSLPAQLTDEELECENHFISTFKRDKEGRYILRLPFKSNINILGNSKDLAQSTLFRTEKRFRDQPQLHEQYVKFMDDYETSGHMRPVTSDTTNPQALSSFYLPHHGVFKMSGEKPKLRVVFNGSVRLRNGSAINDCLYIGPKLQADIFDVILGWRTHRYVFSADIKQMFRQILIAPEDQRFQRILWRASDEQVIRAFNLCTVTYDLASSPYQAIRVLQQLASDEEVRFPHAAQLLRKNCYFDDVFAGANTLEEASHLKAELIALLMVGGFPLSKWTSNHPQLFQIYLKKILLHPIIVRGIKLIHSRCWASRGNLPTMYFAFI